MKLPNWQRAWVPEPKITAYLLSLTHRVGRGKAGFFRAFGFRPEEWERLADALIEHAAENDVASVEDSPFGTRYIVDGIMTMADGRLPTVRTVWFIGTGETAPRFVTAYPIGRRPR